MSLLRAAVFDVIVAGGGRVVAAAAVGSAWRRAADVGHESGAQVPARCSR